MKCKYRDVTPQDYELLTKYWDITKDQPSDYTPIVLIAWRNDYDYKICHDEKNELIWLCGTEMKTHNLAPLGDCNKNNWEEIIETNFGKEVEFEMVCENLLKVWKEQLKDKITLEERRGYWEYLYDANSLATLKGNRLMAKRNKVNKFTKTYEYEYIPFCSETSQMILDFQKKWCLKNYCASEEGLLKEDHAIHEILTHWGKYQNLAGGAISIEGKIIAYTIGEIYKDNLYVHFEKANINYPASYQIINKEFVSRVMKQFPNITTVNREEDLDDEGLRHAKMSYMPKDFLKKYYVKISL
ncbi:MAG: phosphatidylglycerol lysyltransferase domain-containing protein [Synergistaceae bacterium]